MARLPRLTVAGLPHHVIQRGNNGQAVFVDDTDRELMLSLMADYARQFQVAIHAYLLLDNRVQLLLTPAKTDGLAGFMQAVGRRYVRLFNDRHARTGTLWEGRYRSTVLEPESHLLPCMVHMDLGPVRAGLVDRAEHYPWSSHRHHIGQAPDRLITPHPLWWTLGNTPFAREMAYAELVREGVGVSQGEALMQATLHGWALGSSAFVAALQKQTPRRVGPLRPGRPPRRA
ncbi:MAG TPA: transposase [Hydrogenophaga sp.]|uniref:transposase n=1 Tax=Hydrogenophaga sp. TaxID=1904254 RepID=UPI002C01D364|nr:transposase [Hydrogenophaga sp.]HMN92603.1 transposase [Hydrogenophaga sp.]HMP10383.1 transposase [Hydrogenophaga sp.]